MEQGLITSLTRDFEQVYNMISFEKADMKDFVKGRMDIIGDRFVKTNKKFVSAADNSGQDIEAVKRRIKLIQRKVDQRIDGVNNEHDTVMGKYNYLLTCNSYVGRLAETMIKVVELNSSLVQFV